MAETYTIGGVTLPLPALPAGRTRDPIAHGLLDFLGWYLNTMLGPQMALLYPSTPTPCPTTRRYNYDPKDVWPQNGVPALYLAWKSARPSPWSTVRERELVTYELTWIAPARSEPHGDGDADGLIAIAARALRLASRDGAHSSYSYNGAEAGTPMHLTVDFQGWELGDITPGVLRPVPSAAKGARVNYFPALKAQIKAYTFIEPRTPEDPGDALGDSTFELWTNGIGDIHDTKQIVSVVLPGPDGSEDGSGEG